MQAHCRTHGHRRTATQNRLDVAGTALSLTLLAPPRNNRNVFDPTCGVVTQEDGFS